MAWITSTNRKRHQRALNKAVRALNKNLEEDNLWQGRFYVHQVRASWHKYEDNSGAELFVVLELVDKVTGLTRLIADNANSFLFGYGYSLWRAMNDFIIHDVRVWQNK